MHQDQLGLEGKSFKLREQCGDCRGRSLVCKPRKMRQVRVTTQEGKQGPGNQTRSLETQENGSKMKADMEEVHHKSPSKLVALHPGHIWQSPVPCPSSSTRFGFQVILVGLLCPYCNGDLPAKNKNDLIVYFLSLKKGILFFFFPFNLSNFNRIPPVSPPPLNSFSFAFMTPSLTLYIYMYIYSVKDIIIKISEEEDWLRGILLEVRLNGKKSILLTQIDYRSIWHYIYIYVYICLLHCFCLRFFSFELNVEMFPEHFSDPLSLYLLFPISTPLLSSFFSSASSFPSLFLIFLLFLLMSWVI